MAPVHGVRTNFLQVFCDRFPLSPIFASRDGVRTTHGGVHNADQGRAVKNDHLIEHPLHELYAGPLLLPGAPQIFVGPEARGRRTTDQTVSVELTFHIGRVDVSEFFDGDFDGFESPILKATKKVRARVGKGRREEKCVDAEAHSERSRGLVCSRVWFSTVIGEPLIGKIWNELTLSFNKLSDDVVGESQAVLDDHFRVLVEEHHADT